MFYRWTLLLNFCCLIAFGQEFNSLLQSNPRELAKARIDDFKLRLGQALEKSTTFWNYFVQGRTSWVPIITSRRFELGLTDIPTQGCTAKVAGTEISFFVTASNTLSMLSRSVTVPISEFPENRHLHSLQAFGYDSEVWFISHIGKNNNQYIELDKFDGSSIAPGQRLEIPGPSIVSSVEVEQVIYTAVAIMNRNFPEFKLFRWSGQQFGEILSTRIDGNCSALAIWKIEEFIYVALSFTGTRSLAIKRVVEYSEQMHTLQLLGVDAHVIKHFSHAENHYLVLGTHDSVIIYWWSGSSFLMEHLQIFYNAVSDVAINMLSGKVVLAVVFNDEVKFLVQDTPTRSYILAGNVDVSPISSLKTVLLWRKEKLLYMLPIFKESHPLSVHEIALEFEIAGIQREPRLKGCLNSLFILLSERQKKIDKMLSRGRNLWSSSREIKIKSLKINGMIKSLAKSRVGSLHITGVPFPFPAILNMSKEMVNTGERLRSELKKSVFKSTVQIIESRSKFENLTVGKGAIIGLDDRVNLNKVTTTRLPFALKKSGHQTFEFRTNVSHVLCGMAKTVTMNKIKMEDYLLLKSGSLKVTGRFKFSDVSVKTLLIQSNVINGINMNNFVLTSKKQDVNGTKLFKSLSAEAISTEKRVGEVDKIKEMVSNRDSKSFSSYLNFNPVLIIRGNLNIKSLNGFNMLDFYSKSVKKFGKQDVRGIKAFKSITITGNMDIGGHINKCAINNLMTVTTDQTIYGAVTFGGTAYFQTILTDYLNGIDLSEQAVGRFHDNVIGGVKTFRQTLTVSDVRMKEGIVIDSIDPSAEMSNIISMNVTADACWFNKDVTVGSIVTGNIKLAAGSFPLLERLGGNVWLKTTEQNISNLEATVTRMNNLGVSKVNGIAVEDLVTVNGNVDVNGLRFKDDVLLKTLSLTEGSILQFSSESSDPNVKVKIMNKLNLESAVFEGDISVDSFLNGFEAGFMHNEKFQTLKDQIEFERIELKELHSKNLKFQLLNKTNFTDYFERAVVPFKNRSISNKHFKILKGTGMSCNGILNNVSIDRVATTNTKQKIVSSWKFATDISFVRMSVRSFFDEIRLEDIFYIDEVGSMSNKQFNGNLTATLVNMRGYINDVNITHLQLKAFNKTKGNVVEKKIKFYSNLTTTGMQVKSKIDNVNLKDLIRLNETVKLERLNAASVVAMNTTVKGLVNGCPWTSILQNILSFMKFSENITSRISVKSLVIDGNLNLEYLNGARIPDWITLLGLLESSDSHANVTFENLKADNIQFLKPVNKNSSIDFLVNDAVKKSLFQVITSEKRFQEISVDNVKIDQLNTNKTCGLNISDLVEASLNRISQNGTQLKIRTLGGIMAKRVTVEGKLNSLKLPDDTVFLNTTEVFEDEVVIKNTITAISGLNLVANINDIDFNKFLEERVTLNLPNEIFSTLHFTEDVSVQGKTLINGTVNNILLDDVVTNLLQNQTALNGTKTFTEEVTVSDLSVTGSVNGIFPDDILRSSRNETARNVQFLTLNTSSFTCDAINGLSVLEFYNHVHDVVHHVNDKLDDFTQDILSYQDSISSQKDTFEHRLSIFNYFELHEILDFGNVQRFLPHYDYGTLGQKYELQVIQMIMWVANDKSCSKTKSLIADVLQNGTLNVTKMMHGKIFPFSLRIEREDVTGFYVQAEGGCTAESRKRIVIKTMYSSRLVEKTIVSPAGATLVDVKLLEIDDIFLLTAYNIKGPSGRIFIHQFDTADNAWTLHQTFHSQNITSLDVIFIERDTLSFFDPPVYLAVTGTKGDPGVTIYEWDFDEEEFFFKTNISTSASSHALWVDYHNSLYLLLAKEVTRIRKNTTWVDVFTEPLEVYEIEDGEVILNHTVNVKGVCSLEMFILADEAFVLASSNHMETIYILQFRGYNGFEVVQAIPAPGITEARVFTVDKYLYLALNSVTGKSRILKASIHGGRLDLD